MSKKIFFETEETRVTKRKGWIEFDTDFIQVYNSFCDIGRHIKSATAFKLLFWLLANHSNSRNGFSTSTALFVDFNKHLGEGEAITYRTFINCINELVEVKAVNKICKGHYYFNPYVFWKDDKEERQQFITDEKKEGKALSFNPKSKKSNKKHLP